MPLTRVRVVKSKLPTYWYSSLIGREFDVYQWASDDFVLKEDYDRGDQYPWRHIAAEDVVEV